MRLRASLILVGGRVLTFWSEEPEAEGIALGHGLILAVGSRAEVMSYADQETRVEELEGRLALPGFIDSHCHLASTGSRTAVLSLDESSSLSGMLSLVKRSARIAAPGSWVLGRGWDESRWPEKRFPTLAELDAEVPDNPVVLTRVDGHVAVASSMALELLRLDDISGVERDAHGRASGVLREAAADRVWEVETPSILDIAKGITRMTTEAHRLGVTSVHDIVDEREAAAYIHLSQREALQLRVNLMPRAQSLPSLRSAGVSSGLGGSMLRLGPLKLFLDGSIGARTAALSGEFRNDPENRGWLSDDEEGLLFRISEAADSGFQLALHAIGDRAIRLALDGISKVDHEGRRHRIEHFELPSEDDILRAARTGVVASMQPNFVGRWSQPGGLYEERLGEELARMNNPFRRILDEGVTLAFGSDFMPFSPLYGIHSAVNAPYYDQRLTVEEALRAYTQGGAFASFEEETKGTLRPGMVGDVVVLEKDPREVRGKVNEIGVHMTVFNGRIVYKAR